jgi:hypothetical protein
MSGYFMPSNQLYTMNSYVSFNRVGMKAVDFRKEKKRKG